MTFEKRMWFLLEDIQTLLLRCTKCGATVAHDLFETPVPKYNCPTETCTQPSVWDNEHHHLVQIINGLNAYLHSKDSSPRAFDVAFELKDPPDARPGEVKVHKLTGL